MNEDLFINLRIHDVESFEGPDSTIKLAGMLLSAKIYAYFWVRF